MKPSGPVVFFVGFLTTKNRYRAVHVSCFFSELWLFVFFNEHVYFIYILEFTGIKLFIIFFNYPFSVCRIYKDVPFSFLILEICVFCFPPIGMVRVLLILYLFSKVFKNIELWMHFSLISVFLIH